MGPLDRGGLIQNKSFYSQPVFLVAVLRVSYSLSLICLMTSEDIKHKILSHKLPLCVRVCVHVKIVSRWPSWAVRPNELSGFRGLT